MENQFFDARLESLRGIAALGVAWTHANMVFVLEPGTSNPVLGTIRAWLFQSLPAGGAVVLFYALSGYVLGLALTRDGNYVRFATRRLFRIFPALWVAVTLTFLLQSFTAAGLSREEFHPWFQNIFLNGPTWADLARNLVLAKANIDPVIWTLIPEVVCSLALPGLVFLHFRTNFVGRLALLGFLAMWGHHAGDSSIQFAASFYAGFLLPSAAIAILADRPVAAILVVFAGWFVLCVGNAYGVPYTPPMRESCTVGAAMVISGLVAAPRSLVWLTWRPVRFLGRISFSFYLLHLPALYTLAVVAAHWPAIRPETQDGGFVFAVASIGVAIAAAAVCHRYAEKPAIAAGRKVAAVLTGLHQRGETAPATPAPLEGGEFART
jgi:peptidoglycan/LPS O-acetylase OafA/YrhL